MPGLHNGVVPRERNVGTHELPVASCYYSDGLPLVAPGYLHYFMNITLYIICQLQFFRIFVVSYSS